MIDLSTIARCGRGPRRTQSCGKVGRKKEQIHLELTAIQRQNLLSLFRRYGLPLFLGLTGALTCGSPPSAQAHSAPGSARQCGDVLACSPIKHIVFIIKEDRTFDNLFGTFPGANGTTSYQTADGKSHTLGHTPLDIPDSLTKDSDAALQAI